MIDFHRSPEGVFASASLTAHLIRGGVAAAALAAAYAAQASSPLGSLALGIVALVALRGCPVCWTVGLVETLGAKFGGGPASGA